MNSAAEARRWFVNRLTDRSFVSGISAIYGDDRPTPVLERTCDGLVHHILLASASKAGASDFMMVAVYVHWPELGMWRRGRPPVVAAMPELVAGGGFGSAFPDLSSVWDLSSEPGCEELWEVLSGFGLDMLEQFRDRDEVTRRLRSAAELPVGMFISDAVEWLAMVDGPDAAERRASGWLNDHREAQRAVRAYLVDWATTDGPPVWGAMGEDEKLARVIYRERWNHRS